MCSPQLWGHSISIGYRASIKCSMKAQRSNDTPIPSNPVTPHPPIQTTPCSSSYSSKALIRIWRLFYFEEIQHDHLKKRLVSRCYLLLSFTLHILSGFIWMSFWPYCETILPPSLSQGRQGLAAFGKSIWLPCHSSCNFNSGGTVKWSEDFFAVI